MIASDIAVRAGAFLRRDAALQVSYRMALVLELVSAVFVTTTFFFLARVVDPAPMLERYRDVGYFAFALTGIAFSEYLWMGLHGFSEQIRQGQVTGTLEGVFLSPARNWEIVASTSLWSFAFQSVKVVFYLLVGIAFGLSLDHADWASVAVTIVLSILALAPLGIVSAAFILVWKRGDPLSLVISWASTLLAGVYYPVEVLPSWLRTAAAFFPLTHALEAFRAAVLNGASIRENAQSLAALGIFAIVLTPLALFAFSAAVAWSKRSGGLGQY